MASKKLFTQAFILLVAITITFLIDVKLNLNWIYWWFDMIEHFSAGVCVAMGGIAIWAYLLKTKISKSKIIWIGLCWVILVGVVWEVFELYFDLTSPLDGIVYYTDTSSDLFLDIFGGLLGALYSYKILNKNNG